jgi:uncharacterized protein (DUF433 family)
MAATWRDRIAINPDVHHGEPVVRGTRVSVSLIIGSLADDDTADQLLTSYPQLTMEDIRAALRYAAEAVTHVDFVPLAGAP